MNRFVIEMLRNYYYGYLAPAGDHSLQIEHAQLFPSRDEAIRRIEEMRASPEFDEWTLSVKEVDTKQLQDV
jgi:hypothetical protein